jgi:methylenetetrahydrofolate dehydrogenase (NADP+)/methenyltetrahydrofolate cyclohydrolase
MKGKPVADLITEKLIVEVENLKRENIIPKLAIIRVGNNEEDLSYERGALKRCEKIGISTEVIELPTSVSREKYIQILEKLNEDVEVNGILCLQPLPKSLEGIKYKINPAKDVDCFNPINFAKIIQQDNTGFSPCTPSAVIEMLKFYNVDLKGKNVAVLGRSMIVGKPLSMMLVNEDATVTICHSKTEDLKNITKKCDIVISAIGKAKMIDSTFIKEGAIVVDVGINVDEEGKLCGDVNFNSVLEKTSMITPVPAGVGSVTTSILAKNIIKACKLQNNK